MTSTSSAAVVNGGTRVRREADSKAPRQGNWPAEAALISPNTLLVGDEVMKSALLWIVGIPIPLIIIANLAGWL
jgi:hypothetical protein